MEKTVKNQDFISSYFVDMGEIIRDISVQDIDKVVELLFQAWKNGNKVFSCGNGGSAATATHFTCDLAKTTIVDEKSRNRA